ncbi:hypothetical protein [Streptomyces marispadix]|uniref:Uncharacterized protein n=1 Tax=Streptomyces marispadix TaxID=2922868 RepID=A0ABS9SYJ0_9ACTN|nr:hypothetical protein [Streptomyces marispadix]MCH6161354.1 hypothetical protein [Streptomyces marispadix]
MSTAAPHAIRPPSMDSWAAPHSGRRPRRRTSAARNGPYARELGTQHEARRTGEPVIRPRGAVP